MHNVALLQDLAVVMLVSGVVTVLFHWLRQPVVLGYILAGVLIGPHLLPSPLVTSQENVHTLAELGVVFLLFALGLEFNFRKLRQVGPTAFLVAPLETALLFFAGFQIGRIFGWPTMDCVYLGGILMISSTTIIAKTLSDLGRSREPFAQAIFGILIVEDIIAVLLVAALSAGNQGPGFGWTPLLGLLFRLSEFVVVAVVLGLLGVPWLLRFVGRIRGDETLLVTVLGLCFGLALLAAKLGFSVGLGAFIMGALIAESDEIRRIERLIAPVRDMFSAVFFVAIGMLINPDVLREHALAVTVITVALVGGKVVACSFGSFLAGHDRGTALRVGFGLGQIGEFSFIIAGLGASLGLTSSFLYPVAVGVAAATTVLTPYLIRHADALVALHDRLAPGWLLESQHDYLTRIRALRQVRATNPVRRILWTIGVQLAVNVALIAALFLGAMRLLQLEPGWLQRLPGWTGGPRSVLCFAALLVSLPIVVAFLRKLQALGLLLAELAVRDPAHPARQASLRAWLANALLAAGSLIVSALILLLSAPLLPPWKTFLVLGILTAVIAVALRPQFVRLYARAQARIRETLARPHPDAEPEGLARPLPPLLEHAGLRTVHLPGQGAAAGRTIRELQLRTRTGATVIALRRGDHTHHNPEADVRLHGGDELLLLGEAEQLEAGEELLTAN